jgi:TatD DNase family protein
MNLESLEHIDAHAHLNFDQFNNDRDELIAKMKERGIGAINIGIDEKTSRESITLAESHEHIWASVGCHPTEVDTGFDVSAYQALIHESDRVVAVGECGLDYSRPAYRTQESKNRQADVFIAQIKLAAETNLPLILHIRPREGAMRAYKDALNIIEHYQKQTDTKLSGTAHFFVGDKDIAKQFIDLGFLVSFTGPLTYDSRLQDVCAYIPLDKVLAETDSPFAAPEPHRGKRNSPLYVPEVEQAIADCHGEEASIVRQHLKNNTKQLFGLTA